MEEVCRAHRAEPEGAPGPRRGAGALRDGRATRHGDGLPRDGPV